MLIRGAYVWTGSELVQDGAVLTEPGQGTVQAVGTWADLRAQHPTDPVLGGPDAIVLPGLINAHHHGHGVTALLSGARDQCLEPWLASLGDGPAVDPYLDTLWAAVGLLQGGYTTVVLFQSTRNPETAAAEAHARIRACRTAGLRVALGLDITQQHFYVYGPDPDGWPPRHGLRTETYLAILEDLRRAWADDHHVSIFPAPSGLQWVTDETWQAIGAWSREHSTPLHTHCLESPYEAAYATKYYGGDAVGYLDRMGALHSGTSLVHGVYLCDAQLERMAAAGASLITNPGSNLRLRCGISPVLAALDRGVTVALGTDGLTVGDADDALAEMRLLLHLQRTPGLDTPALTWQQVLSAATDGAAAVTAWQGQLGTIAPGLPADVTVYDYDAVQGPWAHPRLSPLEVLVQRGSSRHLHAVVVAGRPVWQAGAGPVNVSAAAVKAELREHMQSLPLPEPSGLTETVTEFYRDWADPPLRHHLGVAR